MTGHNIQKYICSLALSMLALCSSASESYFSSDFDAMSDDPLDGWTCSGLGKTAKKSVSTSVYFPDGCEAYRVLSFPGVEDAAYSNSSTEEGGKVEEWLISPEIRIPEDKNALLLTYEEVAIGSIRPGEYSLYLSEEGTDPEDFSVLLHSGRPKGGASEAKATTVHVPVNGYAGKNIHIAFVNRSNGTALLGFTRVSLYDYAINVESLVPEFTSGEGDIDIKFDVSIVTPSRCNGFTTRLYVEGEEMRENHRDVNLENGFDERIEFNPPLGLSFGIKKNYRFEVTFADPSLPGFSYEGSVTCAEGFPGVCVMEEATGTWCPACVRGTAALKKFTDDWPGQFFGIAVHENDPMTVSSYNVPFKDESHISSFPSGWFNRETRDDPQKSNIVREYISQRLATSVRIDKVCRYTEDGKEKLTVLYSPQICHDSEDADLRAVVVLTEDHCKGERPGWSQKNGYSGSSPESVGGEDWWPYFEFFSNKGKQISAQEMEYNHVAWGIYNDYDGSGSNISRSWKAYTPQQYSITFDVPFQEDSDAFGVQDITETAVTVILLDGKTGHVAGADRLEASGYVDGDPSGITGTASPRFRVSRHLNEITVEGESEANVEVFDTDGRKLGIAVIDDGKCRIPVPDTSLPMIVRIITGRHTFILKVL